MLVVAEMTFQRAEDVERVAQLRPAGRLAGRGQRVARQDERVEVAQLQRRLIGDTAEPGDDRKRDPGLDTFTQRLRRLLGGREVAGVPRVQGPPVEDSGMALRLAIGVELGE